MTLPHPLPQPLVELIAQRFRILGEPTRIHLLDSLREGEASVQELADATHASQQNVSKHLATLHAAGIVARRKEGTRTMYCIADETVFDLCEHVCGGLRQHVAELGDLLAGAAQ